MNGESQDKLSLWSWRPPRRPYLWALSLVLAVCAGVLYDRWVFLTGMPRGAENNFQLMAQAWNIIHQDYVDRASLQSSVLTHAAIAGMTDSLGDSGHTVFLNPEMRRHASAAMRSHFTGIGVEIKTQERRAVIVAALDGSPAWRAGVRAGDIILEVDGRSVAGLPLSELDDLITGRPGPRSGSACSTPATGGARNSTSSAPPSKSPT